MTTTVIWTVITVVNYCINIKEILFSWKAVINSVYYCRITSEITAEITMVNRAVIYCSNYYFLQNSNML